MSTNPYNRGPLAPQRNPPIEPENFEPSRFQISAISLGKTTIVTTSVAHNYVIGQNVRLLIPPTYGSRQLNEAQAMVISLPSTTQVVLQLDSSRNVDPFISSPTYGPTPASIMAIGDFNSGIISSTGRTIPSTAIPGSFQNISPQ